MPKQELTPLASTALAVIQQPSSSDVLIRELTVAVDAYIGVIAVRCAETEVYRVVDEIFSLSSQHKVPFYLHTTETGWGTFDSIDPDDERAPTFNALVPKNTSPATADTLKAFQDMYENGTIPNDAYLVMLDLFHTFEEPKAQNALRKQAQRALNNGQRLYLIVPNHAKIPDAIAPLLHIIEYGFPTREELRITLEDTLENVDRDESGFEISETEIDIIISNGQGMTTTAFETAIAFSITEYGTTNSDTDDPDNIPMAGFSAEHIIETLRDYKTQLLRKTDVLELQRPEPMENIGGLEQFKRWMVQRRETFTDRAKENGVTPSRGCMVIGPPGCKAEGTIIEYRRGKRNSSRPMVIEDFVAKFNGNPVARSKGWDLSKPTYVQSWDAETGAVFYNQVIGAYETGEKPVMEIHVDDEVDFLLMTHDDGLLAADGNFIRVHDLQVGHQILVRGSMKPTPQGGRSVNRPSVLVEGLKYYGSGWTKTVYDNAGDYIYKRQHRARLVVEAHMNGVSYDEYLHCLRNEPDHPYRRVLSSSFEVHHLDEDALNDELSNLEVLTKSAHLEQHRQQSIANLNVEYTRTATVICLREGGVRKTYDLQMAAPCANYVCNSGFIAHNTGKSLVAKAAGNVLGLPVIRFDVGKVFGSFIGQSEQAMRGVLTMLDAMAPCVLFLDEVDKGFSGMTSGGGDSGTTMRVFGTFLTWMQERDQVNRPVFLIMTANRIEGLPPELLRRGRIDEIWAVSLPNEDERKSILTIHAGKRGQSIVSGDMPSLVRTTEGLVGAEIEAMIEDALVMSLSADEPGITYESVEEARASLKPMSETRAAEFDHMRAWAEQNARPASDIPKKQTPRIPPTAPTGKTGRGRIKARVKRPE